MFVRNVSSTFQAFRAGGVKFKVAPGEAISLSDVQAADRTMLVLISKGVFVEERDPLLDAMPNGEVHQAPEESVEDAEPELVAVQCSGVTKSGKRCARNVLVHPDEYEEGVEYFCNSHMKSIVAGDSGDDDELPEDGADAPSDAKSSTIADGE